MVGAEDEFAILLSRLEANLGRRLTSVAVKDNLLHAPVTWGIVNQGGEEFVCQPTANLRGGSSLLGFRQSIDASLDQVSSAVELVLPVLGIAEEHLALGMLHPLVAFTRVEDKV